MTDNHIFPFLWMRGEPEDVLRTEIEKIYESGIRSVCLEARPHPDYAGDQWWHDVDIVIDEAKKRNMTIWILDDAHFPTGLANNAMKENTDKVRRFLVTQFADVVGPVPSVEIDVNELTKKAMSWMDFGKPIIKPLLGETRILSVTATKVSYGDIEEGTPIDLTAQVVDGYLTTDIPEGIWRIHVNFISTAFDPKPDYINYIDADSVKVLIDAVYEKHYARYQELFGTVIAGFFSDEPGFYNTDNFGPGKVGMQIPLPWCDELEAELKATYGDNLYRDLSLLFADHEDKSHRGLRYAYMDIVSLLYGKNFTKQLGDWCRAHNVEYIGHVIEDRLGYMQLGAGTGHYFRAMDGQDMAGIDNIGNQLVVRNESVIRHLGFPDNKPTFYHYYLAKLGASSAAIDPKKRGRLMCENFGASGWNLGVRDMKWLVDYLINQGVNYFVPHAFSMADYPDDDCPPHYYAHGNNPQFPYFCNLMRYTDRLCTLFSGGKNISPVALLFEAEADWTGDTMQGTDVGQQLITNQLDFLIIPADVFAYPAYFGCTSQDNSFTVNDRTMSALIVPECEFLPAAAARFIAENPGLPVLYINRFPIGIAEMPEDNDILLANAINGREAIPLSQVAETLKAIGVDDRIVAEGATRELHQYHYYKDGHDIFHLMNASIADTLHLTLALPAANTYGIYDAMEDCTYILPVDNGKCTVNISPYESVVIIADPDNTVLPKQESRTQTGSITLNNFVLQLQHCATKEVTTLQDFILKPISCIDRDFAGTMTYSTSFTIDELPKQALFSAEYVFECMDLTVNGTSLTPVIVPPYTQDITNALQRGKNEIVIRVASTALRDANTKPGPFGKSRVAVEPTGMFGRVEIQLFA